LIKFWLTNHRAVTKIKKDLIQKAKVKKQYAKVRAQEESSKKDTRPSQPGNPAAEHASAAEHHDQEEHGTDEDETAGLHPSRQLMLKDEEAAQTGAAAAEDESGGDAGSAQRHSDGQRRRTRRPGYYDKQLKKAEERRAEAEARAQEAQRRREERERRMAERERHRRAMAKTVGRDGKKKLGRESTILLDKVKKLVGES
jgi:hypothetical protein